MSLISILFGASRAKIGSISVDASISESHVTSADITENPVEEGAKITDHVQIKPKQLTMTGVISDSPINFAVVDNITGAANTIFNALGKTKRSIDAYNRLVDLQNTREPFTVTTGLTVYNNMILSSLQVDREATKANAIYFTATLQEIRIAKTQAIVSTENLADSVKNLGAKKSNLGNQSTSIVPPPNPSVAGTNIANTTNISTGAESWLDNFANVRQ